MTDQTTTATDNASQEQETPSLESLLAAIEPAPVRDMISEKFNEVIALVKEQNSRVASIVEARKSDPNNVDYLDAVWRRVVANGEDADIVAREKRYQKAIETSEKLLAEMRAIAKEKHVRPPMSDEEQAKTRKAINEGKGVIETAMAGAAAFAEMAEKLVKPLGHAIPEGGIMSLVPQPESLMNARARGKSGKGDGSKGGERGYATRLAAITLDGVDVKKKVKGEERPHFNFVAERLSKQWNADTFAGNEVTGLELEEAYYATNPDAEFRDSAAMPDTVEFTFTRDIEVQNTNDDGTSKVPHHAAISVTKWTQETAGLKEKTEEKAETAADEKPDAPADIPASEGEASNA